MMYRDSSCADCRKVTTGDCGMHGSSYQAAVAYALRLKTALEGVAHTRLDDDDGTFCWCPTSEEVAQNPCLDWSGQHHPFCEQARAALREFPREWRANA